MSGPIELVLTDVDGTLVTPQKALSPAAVAAVRGLEAAGIRFAITSGRPPRGMIPLIQALALKTPVAGFNGGLFVTPDLRPLAAHALPLEVLERVAPPLLQAGIHVWAYAGEEWFITDPSHPRVARERGNVGFAPVVVDDVVATVRKSGLPLLKIVGVSFERQLLQTALTKLAPHLGAEVSASFSQPYYLDITHAKANKGEVLLYLSRTLGIPRERIAAVGDAYNDLEMFRLAGTSLAMGNAPDEVKKQATCVTASNAEEGFAQAVAHCLHASRAQRVEGGTMFRISDVRKRLDQESFNPDFSDVTGTYRFDIRDSGTYVAHVDHGRVVITEGKEPADCLIESNLEDFEKLVNGQLNLLTSCMQGRLSIEGDPLLVKRFRGEFLTKHIGGAP